MALRTVSNAGGNWNAVGAWVGGVVPIAGDTVNFTATSGPLTVNVASAILADIDFTNYVNTITFNSAITTNGTINLGTGGYMQAGASGLIISGTGTLSGSAIWSRTLQFTGTNGTYTLGSNLTVTGTISLSNTTSSVFTGNTLNIGGSLTVTTNATISGTTAFNFNGTGTWSHTSTGVIRNNITINTAGTLTIGTNIYYNTGTLTYTAGTVTTTGSTLNISLATTLNTSTLNWNNVILSGGIQTLTSDLNIGGNLTTNTATTTINGLFNVNVSGNLTINISTSGTSTIRLVGTGTWSGIAGLTVNLTINTSGTITVSGTIIYNTGTLTYITGTVITTSSLLYIRASTTMATGTLSWNNVFIGIQSAPSTIVITLNDNFTINGSLQVNSVVSFVPNTYLLRVDGDLILGYYAGGTYYNVTLTIPNDLTVINLNYAVFGINTTVNGFSITILGNLSTANTGGAVVGGTTNLILGGTGTWSQTSTAPMRNNLTINTSGTITISGNVYYNTGTLTYIQGEVITSGSTLNINLATTLNTSEMTWNNIIITSGIQTLTSDLNCQNLTSATVTINGFNVNVSGNLTANGITLIGTATIVLIGTGTWTATNGSNTFRIPIIINTNGIISLPNSLYHESGLTYIKGTVKSNNTTITFGGGTVTTLVNLHKLIFKNVIIGASTTIKMNEFFSGSPSLVTNISSTGTTSNYTITFQDGFEKIAKFVDISNCTLSKPLQLLVLTNSKRNSRNIGIRYINQSPNGIAKDNPSTSTQTTFGAGGILSDPNMR
jgi:hypothetical protein